MNPALIALAAQVGAPLVRGILAGTIGDRNADLAGKVVSAIAERAGMPVGELDAAAAGGSTAVSDAMIEVNADVAPELIALYDAELRGKLDTFAAEEREPLWARLWRPLGMYFLYVLWGWNLIVLHVANAIWKIALPQVDLGVLLQLTTLYLSLYMGGHTVKAVVESWSRKP